MTADELIEEIRDDLCEITDWSNQPPHRQWEMIAGVLAERYILTNRRDTGE